MKQAERLAFFILHCAVMDNAKFNFIKNDFVQLVNTLNESATGKWGKMNAQQMVEHVADFFSVSTGKIKMPFVSSPEHLEKLKVFLYSDKEFRENTKAPVLPDEPFPVRNSYMKESVEELKNEIAEFIAAFETQPGLITQHPVFGDLNFDEWIMLHYKHLRHHGKQFGLVE